MGAANDIVCAPLKLIQINTELELTSNSITHDEDLIYVAFLNNQ